MVLNAATGDHGDLLDVIRHSCRLTDFRDVVDGVARFPRASTTQSLCTGLQTSRIVAAAGIL